MVSFEHEREVIFRGFPKVVLTVSGCLLLLYLASGIHVVEASEMGVVYRFGAHVATEPPGIGYHLPWPVGKIRKVNIKEVKSLTVGFSAGIKFGEELDTYAISGDKNIIHNEYFVQYRTHDAANFLTAGADITETLREIALASILVQVASRPVDSILTTGKRELENAVKADIKERLQEVGLELQILSVERRSVSVPLQVKSAFQDVISAQEEKHAAVHEAETYRNQIIPKTQGEAGRMIKEAEAERFRRISSAQGETTRFLKIMGEYHRASRTARRRLLIEMAERVFPRIKVLVLAKDRKGNSIKIKLLQDPLPTSPRL